MFTKYKKILFFTGIFLLMVSSSAFQGYASTTVTMQDQFGTNFSNDFGLVVDFNYNNGPSSTGVGSNLQVLKDLGNSSNPKVNPVDTDLTNSQQFFFSHFNVDGVDNIYLALNKLEFNISLDFGVKTISFGHVNGSAPFQSLLQFFKYQGNDVLVANTFRGLLAYSTQADNGTISPTANTYFGYSFVESHLLNLLNDTIKSHGFADGIPSYNYEPLYFPENHTFGMKYDNYFVVWQDTTPQAPSKLASYAGNAFDNVVSGSNMVAASLFKYMKFTYHVVEDQAASNSTYKVVNVVANYDLGPMEWLITKDSASAYASIASGNTQIDSSNSFNTAATNWNVTVVTPISKLEVIVPVPGLTYYTGAAVSQRLNAQAMKNSGVDGMGIAIASSTNAFVDGQDLNTTSSVTNDQNTTVPLTYGSSTFFNTNYVGKSTYTRTFNNGTTESKLPVYISLRTLAGMSQLMDTSSLLDGYFQLQTAQTTGVSVYSAHQLDPVNLGTYTASQLNLNIDQTKYVTLVQMPKWSGLQVTQDPTFSAVAAVAGSSSSSSSKSITSGVPGFEFYMAIVAVIPLYAFKKLRQQKR